MFSGHDGTYNLAVMSLKKATVDKFEYQLVIDEKQCLADWIAYFDNRYGRPIARLSSTAHSITLSDLPHAKMIPFSDDDDDDEDAEEPPDLKAVSPPSSRL